MIPIHHMEAHALTPRMEQEIPFPYVVLLVSGGHCLLSVAENVNTFQLLGKQLDNARKTPSPQSRMLLFKQLCQIS